ncbi:bifunctional glycosyltransferase/CDP-glycerol:glycerophosphate glycerophosphotransferase [Streptomyces sp. CS227]|uniref:bifunctional glycosyltransferase/CDP-glycerol:glycerophosphate glycerophosphotransferase n=1 Tax=Streptomyces sp. CS227 TaxID=1982763 RepID=UPI00211B163A|nr:bifunctional glycosyltransferase family 2 protein/CDP-glycerol:glycerophosphate glycerophosphotransferase [Streptomyces sp. CS227]
MPRFSVIVPAHRVEAYLGACLDSVLGQSFGDLEVIAVDDCSPDGCGELIDAYAARDGRVVPVHLPENGGLGRARNAGLERATGEYVLFLDGDDTLTADALHTLSDRIKETDSPEILVFDYARTYLSGQVLRNQLAAELHEGDPQVFTLAERPGLLRLLMVVWNKAYRRDFVERTGLTFPPGYYEDTPWTFPALMSAETIAVLDRVCVHYRQRRQGSILGTVSHRHFDVFDQYDRVFAFLDARPELERWRPVVFRRMVDHFTAVYTKPGRLPAGERAAFLHRARDQYRLHRTPLPPLGPRDRLRHALVRHGSHRAFGALRLAARASGRARRTARSLKARARKSGLRAHYALQRRLPLRERDALFGAGDGHGYTHHPAALERAARDLVPGLRTFWITRPEHRHTAPTATRRVTPGSAAYFTALARARYLVTDGEPEPGHVKRRGQCVVQTGRGTPLKRIGAEVLDRPAAGTTDVHRVVATADQWDYALSGNRHTTLTWERAYPAPYTVLEYGQPRADAFHSPDPAARERLRETLGLAPDVTALLYAPTYRDHRTGPHRPPDLDRMLRRLGPRFAVLARAHPRCGAPLLPPGTAPSARLIDVSGHPSVERLCLASDALITDYSSLMVEYAVLDRPIVLYADDWAAFEAARGLSVDLRGCAPGPVACDEDDLTAIFASGAWSGPGSAARRAVFRARFCPWDDGRAAERVVRRVFLGEEPPAP